jgi:hypothetical protein
MGLLNSNLQLERDRQRLNVVELYPKWSTLSPHRFTACILTLRF